MLPPGLYIGEIEAVSSQDIEQFKKIVVDPAMNPQDLEEVRVPSTGPAGRGRDGRWSRPLRHPRRDRHCARSAARRRRRTLPDLRLLLAKTLDRGQFAVAPLRDLQAVLLGFFGGILLDALGSDLFGVGALGGLLAAMLASRASAVRRRGSEKILLAQVVAFAVVGHDLLAYSAWYGLAVPRLANMQ